ncbi:MAG: hypothetical protein ABI700_19005 [Chloroflexota bacterium]
MADDNVHYTGAPIHPISAIMVIVLDTLWKPVEAGAAISVVGLVTVPFLIAILAIVSFVGVFLVQKFIANDALGSTVAKAFVMSVVVAVPFPVTGTIVGVPLLAWAGLSKVTSLLTGSN